MELTLQFIFQYIMFIILHFKNREHVNMTLLAYNTILYCTLPLSLSRDEMTLMQACQAADINKVKELVQKGAPMVKCGGKTCLEVAIEKENR